MLQADLGDQRLKNLPLRGRVVYQTETQATSKNGVQNEAISKWKGMGVSKHHINKWGAEREQIITKRKQKNWAGVIRKASSPTGLDLEARTGMAPTIVPHKILDQIHSDLEWYITPQTEGGQFHQRQSHQVVC